MIARAKALAEGWGTSRAHTTQHEVSTTGLCRICPIGSLRRRLHRAYRTAGRTGAGGGTRRRLDVRADGRCRCAGAPGHRRWWHRHPDVVPFAVPRVQRGRLPVSDERPLHRVPGQRLFRDARDRVDHAGSRVRQLPRDRRAPAARHRQRPHDRRRRGRPTSPAASSAVPRSRDGGAVDRELRGQRHGRRGVLHDLPRGDRRQRSPQDGAFPGRPAPSRCRSRTTTAGTLFVEKSPSTAAVIGTNAGNFGPGDTCMWCHRSRVDVTNYITPTGNAITQRALGAPRGPAGGPLHGRGRLSLHGPDLRRVHPRAEALVRRLPHGPRRRQQQRPRPLVQPEPVGVQVVPRDGDDLRRERVRVATSRPR